MFSAACCFSSLFQGGANSRNAGQLQSGPEAPIWATRGPATSIWDRCIQSEDVTAVCEETPRCLIPTAAVTLPFILFQIYDGGLRSEILQYTAIISTFYNYIRLSTDSGFAFISFDQSSTRLNRLRAPFALLGAYHIYIFASHAPSYDCFDSIIEPPIRISDESTLPHGVLRTPSS